MAGYVRKSMQILGGGFTCLPPLDKIPITDYALAQNFRSDTLGRLVSRPGYNLKLAAQGAGIAHSAYSFAPGQYFIGCNAAGDGSGGSVWYGGIGAVQVAAGFDGNRVAFAGMNGYVWVMNRGNQGRFRYAADVNTQYWETWTLEAPAGTPGVALGPPQTTAASVDYTYTPQASGYNHFLTIGGSTYSFTDDGNQTAGAVASQIATLAAGDPNCSVSYSGSGQVVTITPKIQNATIPVSGSDFNPTINLNNTWGPAPDPVQGTYTIYYTWQSQDLAMESNPSSGATITVNGEDIVVTVNELPVDPRVGFVNIYASGGTLASPYRIGQIPWNQASTPPATFQWTVDEASAVNGGLIMPTTNDPPPAAAGMIGPHFSRLYAWSTAAHRNRLFWTPPQQPQYFPGSSDEQTGNWVDVGRDDEDIVWCTIHANLLVIHKSRSIWLMIGSDPGTAQLEQAYDGPGLVNQWALAPAGQIDYFVAPGGLKLFDMSMVHDISGGILPLFTWPIQNSSPFQTPGNIMPGGTVNTNINSTYAVALGHAFGRLFVSYAENGGGYDGGGFVLLVFDEGESPEGQTLLRRSGRWFYERTSQPNTTGFFGFVFDGVDMVGLTGAQGANGAGYSLADFHSFLGTDYNSTPIECMYASHYEDAGQPDNDKMWLEAVIDYAYDSGQNVDVYIGFNSAQIIAVKVGELYPGQGRQSVSFAPGSFPGATDAGYLARNMAVFLNAKTTGTLVIYNVYLYYYVEARLALVASTIPTDLGSAKIKECKELELDIDASVAPCVATVVTDMPGNAIDIRYTANIGQNKRSLWKYAFTTTQGYLWQVAVNGRNFRLYSARLLMRVIGVHVDAYEAAAGFVWDSMETDCGTPVYVKQAREIALEADFNGSLTLKLLTDIPGDAQAVNFTTTLNSTGGRRIFMIPLPQGTNAPVQGRIFRIQLSGTVQYSLYALSIDARVIGTWIEAYEGAAGAVWDSLPIDCGTPVFVKRAREIQLEIDLNGSLTVSLFTDLPGNALQQRWSTTISAGGGRRMFMLPLPQGTYAPVEGRLYQLQLSGSSQFALYSAAIHARVIGVYIEAYEAAAGAVWDSLQIDCGAPILVKRAREVQLEIDLNGSLTVSLFTDLPGNVLQQRWSTTINSTGGRRMFMLPLPQGTYTPAEGRIYQLQLSGSSATQFLLYSAAIDVRPVGVYVEAYEAQGGALWDSTAIDFASPVTKTFDQLRFEIDADGGGVVVGLYTDLPGEAMTERGLYELTNNQAGRAWVTVPIPPTEGRSIRLLISAGTGFRVYQVQARWFAIGRYLAAEALNGADPFRTLAFDFESERIFMYKRIEIDVWADSPLRLDVITDQGTPGNALATVYTTTITATTRQTVLVTLPPGIRGRLLRLAVQNANAGGGAARLYHLRVWNRPLSESQSGWEWRVYPLETSDVLPAWHDFPVHTTPPDWNWAKVFSVQESPNVWTWQKIFSVEESSNLWTWQKVLSVDQTPGEWSWVDLDMSVTE